MVIMPNYLCLTIYGHISTILGTPAQRVAPNGMARNLRYSMPGMAFPFPVICPAHRCAFFVCDQKEASIVPFLGWSVG